MEARIFRALASFGVLADATRGAILERLGHGDASISDLAARFDMTLTGHRMEDEAIWIIKYRRMLERRIDPLGEFLERTKGTDR